MDSWIYSALVLEFFSKQLLFLSSSVYSLPVFIGFSIYFHGLETHKIAFEDIKKLTFLCLLLSLGGVLTAFAEPAMLYYHLYIQGLNPRIPSIFEKGILAYTSSALCHGAGIIPLLILNVKFCSLPQHSQNNNFSKKIYVFLILSTILFFISIILKSWPFEAYPDGMGKGYLCMLLSQQALHQFIGSFVHAGICTLVFSWFFLGCKVSDATLSKNSYSRTYIHHFCYLTCIVGIAPQSLMAIGRITNFFLHKNVVPQSITTLWQSFFLVCALICFGLLLFPRFSKNKLWQYIAILAYLISWNWSIMHVL